MSSSASKDINVIIQQPALPVLQHARELVGVLESVEAAEDGLVKISVSGTERRVAEEIEMELRPLLGKKISLLRIGDCWSAVEWKGWRS